jgi:TolB-like protein
MQIAAGVAFCLAVAVLAPPRAAPAAAGLRVAVLDFVSASPDPALAPLGKGLQSMLITDLSNVGGLTLIERERLADVVSELDLQQSDYVDPDTATRLGALLGVTHLLTGGYVVDGGRMQVDARLVALSGEVLLATSVQGERDAFFELEKDLARDLAASLAVAGGGSLEPKVRAKLAHIHTADFGAFRSFSEGLSAFDRKDYDGAIEKLRAATTTDADFELAAYTLSDYERIVRELRARSNQLEIGKREKDRLLRDKERQDVASVLGRLWERTEAVGAAGREDRLTALYLLTVAYGNFGRNRGKLLELRQVEDRFAMERTADGLAKAWFAEASAVWPALPRTLTDRFWRDLPEPGTFDEDFASARERLWRQGADHPENRLHSFLSDMRYPENTARRLHLDRREEVALLEELAAQGVDLGAEDSWRKEMEEKLIDEYRAVLRLDDSTRLLAARSKTETNAGAVRSLAEQIERNQELAELLQGAKDKQLVREWLLLARDMSWSHQPIVRFAREQLLGPRPTWEGLETLNRARELDMDDYVLIDGQPLWAHQAYWAFRTGPRTDLLRAEGLRYFEPKDDAETPGLVLFGAQPFSRGTLSAELDPAPAPDFWPRGVRAEQRPDGLLPGDIPDGRPAVGFLLGLTDVNCDKQENPRTEQRELTRPMTGWMVEVRGDTLRWIAVRETERASYGRKEGFDEQVLAEQSLGKGDGRQPVRLEVAGKTVTVKVGGTRARFQADRPIDGFAGLLVRGAGYVGIEALTLRTGG